jgi:Kef-type K+ transport system membrane component KefB
MWQLITIVVLFGLMGGLSYLPTPDPTNLVAATGFVLLAAFTMGEFFKRIRLPSLLGYIVAGIVFGPELAEMFSSGGSQSLALLPRDLTDGDKLAYVQILTVGVIGTMGGGELKMDDLEGQLGTILKIVGLTFVMIVPFSAAAVYGLATYAPEFVPFLQGVPTTTKVAVSALFGVFGFAMSPAATLAIIQESNAKGRFTSLVLGVVIVADLLLVASYLLTFAFSEIVIETGSLAWAPVMAALPTIGAEFMWALIIGAVTGLLFILYFRFVAREMIFFTVGTIFATSYVCDVLHAEKLLAFITAGFLVQNLSKHGHDMIEALERISLPVFVVYFTIKAAGLNLQGVVDFIVLTGILTLVRTGAIWVAVKKLLPMVTSSLRPDYKRYLWVSFFSRGGVDLVLAGLLASQTGPGWGWTTEFQSVIMAIVAFHLIGGPPLLKLALDGVGETSDAEEKAEEQSKTPLGDHVDIDVAELLHHPFPSANVDDPELTEHLDELRHAYTRVFRKRLLYPVRQHNQQVQQITERVESQLKDAFEDLDGTLKKFDPQEESLEDLATTIRQRHMRFRQGIQPQIELIEQLDTTPINPGAMGDLLEELRGMEGFETHYRVDWGSEMLQPGPDDGLGTRAVKFSRRIYDSIFGGGSRIVPLGRLWRYFVELSVPERLARAAQETCNRDERFWFEFGEHIRRVDQLYERVYLVLEYAQSEKTPADDESSQDGQTFDASMMLPMSASPPWIPFSDEARQADISDFAELPTLVEAEEAGDADPVDLDADAWTRRARQVVQQSREQFEQRADYLGHERSAIRRAELERYTLAMRGPYADFLDGITRAGTIELPAFRYRPSSKFDQARRAEHRLLGRLNRHTDIIDGYRGWIVVDQQLILFLHWFDDYRDRIIGVLEQEIREKCLQALRHLESRCSERPHALSEDEADIDWEQWLSRQIAPSLERTRQALNSSLAELSQGRATRQLLDVLENRITRFSEQVTLLDELPHEVLPEGADAEIVEIPLRQWFRDELFRDAALRFVEFNDHAERGLRRSLVSLRDVEQILEFNLGGGQRRLKDEDDQEQMNQMAEGGLSRAASRLREISKSLLRDEVELRRWTIQKISRGTCQVAGPFLRDDVREIPARLGDSTSAGQEQPGAAAPLVEPLLQGWRALGERVGQFTHQLTDELREALAEEPPAPTNEQVRQRLQERPTENSELPIIYRRLFSPNPIDIPEFYIRRPSLESACMQAAEQWFSREHASVLVYGDRGMGKRTLVKHLLPLRLFDQYPDLQDDQVVTVQLGKRIESEAQLGEVLSQLVEGDDVTSLETLAGRLRNDGRRRVVFLEDAAHLFARTSQGLERMERFLQFVSNTSDQILWYVMLGKPAATLLDTALDLFDYFTHTLELEPLDEDDLREMIMARHRVSGFRLEFEPPEPRILDRLRHPVETADRVRHPERSYFERLNRLSGGNPMLALLYWLESVRPDPEDDTLFRVDPLARQELPMSAALSLRQKLLIATIIQHQTVSIQRAASVVNAEQNEVQVDLNHLERLGFIETMPGRRDMYRMRAFAEPLVTREFRRENLL